MGDDSLSWKEFFGGILLIFGVLAGSICVCIFCGVVGGPVLSAIGEAFKQMYSTPASGIICTIGLICVVGVIGAIIYDNQRRKK